MTSAALDRLLAALLVAELATGLISLRAGTPDMAPLFWVHGLLGGALLVATIEKLRRTAGPAWRRRRWRRLALGTLLTLLVAAALVGGFAWVASGRILAVGAWTVLTLHVWAALAVIPVVLLHLVPRRWRLLRAPPTGPRVSRRAFLSMALVGSLGALSWGAANALDRISGGVRRFTGSRWLPDGGVPPVTTFYGEGTPAIDQARWRLRVTGRIPSELQIDLPMLRALGEDERDEILDCTSGWAMKTAWRGTPLRAVLDRPGQARPPRRSPSTR